MFLDLHPQLCKRNSFGQQRHASFAIAMRFVQLPNLYPIVQKLPVYKSQIHYHLLSPDLLQGAEGLARPRCRRTDALSSAAGTRHPAMQAMVGHIEEEEGGRSEVGDSEGRQQALPHGLRPPAAGGCRLGLGFVPADRKSSASHCTAMPIPSSH